MSQLSRRRFLKNTGFSVGMTAGIPWGRVGSAAGAPPDVPAPRPNLLFILADQWRFSAFGHGTDEVVRTPHIDRLAEEGAVCQRTYAANPVCTPNRSCLLTGRFSHQNGMIANDLMLPPAEVCWPELFRDAGYATHYIGKWHMDGTAKPGFVPPGWRRRGFETFEGFNRGHVYHDPWGFDDKGQPLADSLVEGPSPYYEPALQTDLAMRFMREHQQHPFCCYLSWGPPHTPFRPPASFARYQPADIRLRANVPEQHQEQARRDLAGYYGLCESLDHEMGRLMTFLEENALSKNTLVVFTADHGELAGSHGKYRKGEPEEESAHVPLIARWPARITAGQSVRTLVSTIDLMPTMLSACGLEVPQTCTGRDLAGTILEDRPTPGVDSLYVEGKVNAAAGPDDRQRNVRQGAWRSLVTDRYKLTVRRDVDHVEHLFDLQNDPFETENLAGQNGSAAIQRELVAELKDWAQRTGDVFPERPQSAKAAYTDAEAEAARG